MVKVVTCLFLFYLFVMLVTNGCATQLRVLPGVTKVGYTIQVGAFSKVGNAERLTSRLQAKGIDAFYFKRDNGLYAVRFGDYPTREKARREASKLVSEAAIGTYFIAPPLSSSVNCKTDGKKGKIDEPCPRPSSSDMGAIAARTAERFVGIPYRWGGNNVVEGMDCSGFVRAVYNLCGVNIPRTSREQFKAGEDVSRGDLRDGDLVFFGDSEEAVNHVGIYTGKGRFVHAPRRGDDIRVSTIDEGYFAKRYVGARRYL